MGDQNSARALASDEHAHDDIVGEHERRRPNANIIIGAGGVVHQLRLRVHQPKPNLGDRPLKGEQQNADNSRRQSIAPDNEALFVLVAAPQGLGHIGCRAVAKEVEKPEHHGQHGHGEPHPANQALAAQAPHDEGIA